MKFRKRIDQVLFRFRDEDDRNLILNILYSFTIKGASLIVSMLTMPLYIEYFDDNAVLGIWYTVLSILSWISICDLGLGNGLRNSFTISYSLGDYQTAKRYTSSTYASLTIIIIPIMVITSTLINVVDLNAFLGVAEKTIDSRSLKIAVQILLSGMLLSFVLKTINYVIYAIQKSSLNNLIALITSILPLLYILIADKHSVAQNLINLSIVHILSINLPLIIATIVIFSNRKMKLCSPSIKYADITTAKKMLSFGMQFFLAQIFFMGLMATNEIVITRIFSTEDVVDYSIYYKIFTIVGSLFMIALTPLWSKVTKDLAEKKYKKIKNTNRILYAIAGVAMISELAIVPFVQTLVNIWLRDDAIIIDPRISIVFAFFGGFYILNVVLTTVANGIGDLKTQIIIYGIGFVLKIPSIIVFEKLGGTWPSIVAYNCFVLFIFCLVQVIWVEKKINRLIKMNS